MDGKGAWRDNVFVERFWRTIKYEEVYLHAYDSVAEARQSIGRYLAFYNARRPHTALDQHTPDQAYFEPLPLWPGTRIRVRPSSASAKSWRGILFFSLGGPIARRGHSPICSG